MQKHVISEKKSRRNIVTCLGFFCQEFDKKARERLKEPANPLWSRIHRLLWWSPWSEWYWINDHPEGKQAIYDPNTDFSWFCVSLLNRVIQDHSNPCNKGTEESTMGKDSSVPLIHYDPSRSWINLFSSKIRSWILESNLSMDVLKETHSRNRCTTSHFIEILKRRPKNSHNVNLIVTPLYMSRKLL